MKKLVLTVFILLMIVSLLASCINKNSPNNTTKTGGITTNTLDSTTNTAVNNHVIEHNQKCKSTVEEFLSSIKSKNVEQIVKYLNTDDTRAYEFFNGLSIESYSITEEIELSATSMKYIVQIDITKSNSVLFPLGSSTWEIDVDSLYGYTVVLFQPVKNKISRIGFDNQSDDV
jgi:hypothetical protein